MVAPESGRPEDGHSPPGTTGDPLDWHDQYVGDGYDPVALAPGGKNPVLGEWNDLPSSDLRRGYHTDSNIGSRWGATAGNRVDADLDALLARPLADEILPLTGAIFGRAGKPMSHRIYEADEAIATKQFVDPVTGSMLVELRSTDSQSMLPGSTHPDGEPIEWHRFGAPAVVRGPELLADMHYLAACTLMAIYWPGEGTRQDFALALAGGLLQGGMSPDDASRFITLAATVAGDEDVRKNRQDAVPQTKAKLDAGERVYGFGKLRDMIDPRIVDAVIKWLGVDDPYVKDGSSSPADVLVAMGLEMSLLHTQHGEYFAEVPANGRVEAIELGEQRFSRHLRREYWSRYSTTVPPSALSNAVSTLEAFAENEPITILHPRLLRVGELTYYNLGGGNQAVLSAHGWEVITDVASPVKFRHPALQLPHPVPVRGGPVGELRQFFNVANDEQFVLLVGYIIQAFHTGPYLFLVLNGEEGSAKSTATNFLMRLIDPCDIEGMRPITEERNLFITMREHHLLPLENLSSLTQHMSDVLCSISTGASFTYRKLGTDKGRVTFNALGTIVMNGITDFAKAPDLRRRSIILELPRIRNDIPTEDLEVAFQNALPRILGAIFDAVCAGIANRATTTLTTKTKMSDAVRFVTAAESALPWPVGTFERTLERNQRESKHSVMSSSHVAIALAEMMGEHVEWRGTWAELKRKLELTRHFQAGVPNRRWPADPKELSDEVRRFEPTLREQGVEVERGIRFGKSGSRGVALRRSADTADEAPVALSATEPPSGLDADSADTADTPIDDSKEGKATASAPAEPAAPEPSSALSALSASRPPLTDVADADIAGYARLHEIFRQDPGKEALRAADPARCFHCELDEAPDEHGNHQDLMGDLEPCPRFVGGAS